MHFFTGGLWTSGLHDSYQSHPIAATKWEIHQSTSILFGLFPVSPQNYIEIFFQKLGFVQKSMLFLLAQSVKMTSSALITDLKQNMFAPSFHHFWSPKCGGQG